MTESMAATARRLRSRKFRPRKPKYISVYQYQVEREGGQRFGPSWMHRAEALAYMKSQVVRQELAAEKLRIRRYWIKDLMSKFDGVTPEIVK